MAHKRIWDNFIEIVEIRKSDSIKFVVATAVRDGVKYINIREFYIRKRDGVWMPGRDGITIPMMVPIEKGTELIKPFEELFDLLSTAEDKLNTLELYDEANAVYMPKKEKQNATKN